MKNRALTFFSLPAVAAALLMAAPAAAQTECQPDDLFCAELRIGPGRAGIRVGGGEPVPPPPPVVIEPAPQPPVVIVEPAPPPPPPVVVQPQPQPPVVYVQPAPPPPPPQTVYVQPMPQRRVVRREDRYPYSSVGLHLHLDGLFGEDLGMGGGGGALRLRPIPHIGIDIGASLYGGQDWNGLDRLEIPLQADVLFFFNPYHRFQVYALVGVGGSIAHAEGFNVRTGNFDNRDYAHLGGEAGLGLEWRINRVFAMNLDVRAFIRQRVDNNPAAEFVSDGQSTDTSGGVVGRVGMTFYFGQ